MTFFVWSFAVSIVSIFMIFSLILYFKENAEKEFMFYGLYCFLLLIYLISKNDMFFIFEGLFFGALNWYVQVLYLNVYLSFALYFTDVSLTYTAICKWLRRYQSVVTGVSTLAFLLCIGRVISLKVFLHYFNYVFLPLHLTAAVFLLYFIARGKSPIRYLFLFASAIYIILSLLALWLTMSNQFDGPLQPIVYFYFAIIIECALFTLGLGYKVRLVYRQKSEIQKDLIMAHLEIQEQMTRQMHVAKQQNLILREQKETQEIATQLAELQTTVLRSQMNSHFVFNVLNSIKLFIMEKQPEKAVTYLNSFARFIRKILDSSIDDSSTLKEELDTLSLYLSIESTRLSESFTYNIQIEAGIRTELYSFPALLLQPFVENAIWHGIMNSPGNKELRISVYPLGEYIVIEIDDNGLGINKTKALESKKGIKSHGIAITESRIREFNLKNKSKINYSIIDKSEIGEKEGTKVEIFYLPAVI